MGPRPSVSVAQSVMLGLYRNPPEILCTMEFLLDNPLQFEHEFDWVCEVWMGHTYRWTTKLERAKYERGRVFQKNKQLCCSQGYPWKEQVFLSDAVHIAITGLAFIYIATILACTCITHWGRVDQQIIVLLWRFDLPCLASCSCKHDSNYPRFLGIAGGKNSVLEETGNSLLHGWGMLRVFSSLPQLSCASINHFIPVAFWFHFGNIGNLL